MKNILKQIEEFQYYELTDKEEEKLQGEPKFGSKVSVKFTDRTEIDKGYLFQLPEQDQDIDMRDFMIHIPNPDNSDGMDSAPPVWVHLNSLLSNDRVKWIKVSGGILNY